jgi:hypothetical protein
MTFSQKTYFVAKDGTGNYSTISQVNSALLNPGDIVSFKSGQQFSDAILNCKKGVTYNTYGGSAQAIIGDSTGIDTCSVLISYKENVTLENLKIYGTAKSSTYNANAIEIYSYLNPANPGLANNINITIQNCTIIGGAKSTETRSYGIFCDGGVKGLNILNNDISYFGEGIYISTPYNVLIDGNEIHNVYYGKPSVGVFNASVGNGGGCIQLWGTGGYVGDSMYVWDANYTVRISNNNLYQFERGAMGTTTISKIIIEYNEVHDNLDERIYHGGIDHSHGLGKIDEFRYGFKLKFPGSIGTIIRYNKIYNIYRHQTSAKYLAHDGFVFKFNNIKYETDGSVYLQKDYSAIDPFYGTNGYSIGAVIDGSGLAMQVYGNLIYNCDRPAITRTTKAGNDFRNLSLKNEVYNNTFWNVGYDPLLLTSQSYNGASVIKAVDKTTPIYVRNNIIYMSNTGGSGIYTAQTNLYEGNNLIFVGSGITLNKYANENFISPSVGIFVGTLSGATYNLIGNASTLGIPLADSSNIFVDPANYDFRLKAGSIAIDAGADLGNDNIGNKIAGRGYVSGTVDIGAFEYDGGNSQSSPTGLKVLLEAPYENGKMRTTLTSSKLLPLSQPYNVSPWNIVGDIILSSTSENYVDWILVQVRSDSLTTIYYKVGILTEDGTVLNPDGSPFSFANLPTGEYYLVIKHRNHLAIMSSKKILIEKNKNVNYDFTDSQSKAYGVNAMAKLNDGRYAMLAGDGDANGVVNVLDFGTVANNILFRGYAQGDIDMNGTVNILDYAKINQNLLKRSFVP